MRFKRVYFEMAESGAKTLEARANYHSLRKIKVGDVVRFFWEHRSMQVQIIRIAHYRDFVEMLDCEDHRALVPGMSKQQALREYEKIYPAWKLRKFGGVLVFAFKEI